MQLCFVLTGVAAAAFKLRPTYGFSVAAAQVAPEQTRLKAYEATHAVDGFLQCTKQVL